MLSEHFYFFLRKYIKDTLFLQKKYSKLHLINYNIKLGSLRENEIFDGGVIFRASDLELAVESAKSDNERTKIKLLRELYQLEETENFIDMTCFGNFRSNSTVLRCNVERKLKLAENMFVDGNFIFVFDNVSFEYRKFCFFLQIISNYLFLLN